MTTLDRKLLITRAVVFVATVLGLATAFFAEAWVKHDYGFVAAVVFTLTLLGCVTFLFVACSTIDNTLHYDECVGDS